MKVSAMQWAIRGAVIAFSGLLNGCAVLTVDVDVYKGPLVNEEDVQLEQILALTTAAKPMLVQLRDNLEWPHTDGLPPKGAICSEKGVNWYRADYVPKPDGFVSQYKSGADTIGAVLSQKTPCNTHFKSQHAQRVNEILYLYQDLQPSNADIQQDKDRGLDSLISKYYGRKTAKSKEESVREKKEDSPEWRLDEVLDGLVRFSQKVLFTANHEGLLSPPGTPGLIIGGIADINRGLFGDFLTDYKFSPFRQFRSDAAEAEKSQYVRVLQAVGNAILFSVNELRARQRHRVDGKDKVKAEVAAVNTFYSLDPQKVLADLLKELQHEKEKTEKKLAETKDRGNAIAEKIGSAASSPPTGRKADKDKANDVLVKATQALTKYRSDSTNLKAIHGVLTDEVVKNIQAQWMREGTETSKETPDVLETFLTGSGGLAGKIENRSLARQCAVPNDEECERIFSAVKYVKEGSTKNAFKSRQEEDGPMPVKWANLLDKFVGHIQLLKKDRETREATLDKDRDQQDKKVQQLGTELAELEAELKEVDARVLQLPKNADAFENARTVIAGAKSDVLGELEKHDQFASPSAVYLLVATHLSKRETAETNAGKKQQFKDAQTVLSNRTPPAGLPALDPTDYQSPMAVMDVLIALLRHRQIDAVDRYGKGSDEDKKATEALESAYQHRAGMIYIRPSSAYLRSSFPSTSLQDDPNLTWDNMLLQQGIRSLPFSSELRDILDPSVRRDRLLTSELDKQYWQNINRVRISGAGRTNQVVAKDDVGNWYVKQYSGEPKDIIKSAKNLALFNLGMNLPIDLAGGLKAAAEPAADTVTKPVASDGTVPTKPKDDTQAKTGADTPPLNRVFEKHRTVYQAKTTAASTKLQEMHTKGGKNTIREQIIKAWENIKAPKLDSDSMDALKKALSAAIQEWDEAAETLKNKPGQEPDQFIVKDLRALSKVDKSLSLKISEIKTDLLKDDAARLPIIAEQHRIIGFMVLDMLNDRKQTLDSYDQAIMFIGDATNPKD